LVGISIEAKLSRSKPVLALIVSRNVEFEFERFQALVPTFLHGAGTRGRNVKYAPVSTESANSA
jgi:hypothetical protein